MEPNLTFFIIPLWREMPLTDLSDNGVFETKASKRYKSVGQMEKCGKNVSNFLFEIKNSLKAVPVADLFKKGVLRDGGCY